MAAARARRELGGTSLKRFVTLVALIAGIGAASAVAAAGTAAAHHQVSFLVAANGAVLAALTSVLINIPIVARAGGQPRLTKALARALLIVIAFGVLGLLVHKPLETAVHSALRIHTAAAATKH